VTRVAGSSCSADSALLGEQLTGSAPHALGWVALEQSGPWGAKAFTASHLDPDLGRAIEAAAAEHDVRPVLVRRPGRHADQHVDHDHDARRLLVAHSRPGAAWLLSGTVAAPEDVLALDWAAVRDGDLDAVRRSVPSLVPADRAELLVCTNGTRDVCCAVEGRPVAIGAAARHTGRVWEVTHTSGHRFAPTAVLLPAGTLHGRLDVDRACDLLAAADRGETVLPGSRGRSTWPAPAQVAELAVREATAEISLAALDVPACVTDGDHAWIATVSHADGRRWRVRVVSEATDVDRRESCLKGPVGLRRWTAAVTEPALR
jgi:hypothetical protein